MEKTSKIIKSNHHPNTTMPAKPYPEVPHLHIFWIPPEIMTPELPWAAYSNLFKEIYIIKAKSFFVHQRLKFLTSGKCTNSQSLRYKVLAIAKNDTNTQYCATFLKLQCNNLW